LFPVIYWIAFTYASTCHLYSVNPVETVSTPYVDITTKWQIIQIFY
jgi:hypothetical protein